MTNAEMNKEIFGENKKKNDSSNEGVLFVVTFYPMLKSLGKVIQDNLYLWHMDKEIKKTFIPEAVILFSTTCNISSYLVSGKLCPLDRKVG